MRGAHKIMMGNDDWIYLGLQKTGSSFMRLTLNKIFNGKFNQKGNKHKREEKMLKKRIRIMTIRDPIKYYFSLWSYGLEKKGGCHLMLKKKLNENDYDLIFQHKKEENFKIFVDYVLGNNELDLYTQRLLRIIIPTNETHLLDTISSKPETLTKDYIKQNLYKYTPNILLPTDSLNHAFYKYEEKGYLKCMLLPNNWKSFFPLESKKVENSSKLSNSEEGKDLLESIDASIKQRIKDKSALPAYIYRLSKERLLSLES